MHFYYNHLTITCPLQLLLNYLIHVPLNSISCFIFLSTYRVQLVLPICTGDQGHLQGHWHPTRINTLRGINLHHPLQPSTTNVVVSRRLVSIFLSPTLKCSLNSGWDRGVIQMSVQDWDVSFCIIYSPLQIKTSLVKSECCTDLWG